MKEKDFLKGCLLLLIVCIFSFTASCVTLFISGVGALFILLSVIGLASMFIGTFWKYHWDSLKPPTFGLTPPGRDRVIIAYGYDYVTKSYRIWMSPLIKLPSTQEQMDAYLLAERITAGEYSDRPGCVPFVEEAKEELLAAGWGVTEVDPPKLLKSLPYWVREAGGDMRNRDENKDRMFWEKGDHAPLNRDLRERLRSEREAGKRRKRQAREDAEFKKAMEPQPDWVVGTDHAQSANRSSVKLSELEPPPMVWNLNIDEIVISWGYDYQTDCFKIWTSPIIAQPSTQAHLDAYSSMKRVASRRYADRQRCVSAVRRAIAKLNSADWRVIQVSPPTLLENLPRWVRESGGEMSDRDPIIDRQNWSKGL